MSPLQFVTRRSIAPIASSLLSASFYLDRNERSNCRCDANIPSPLPIGTSSNSPTTSSDSRTLPATTPNSNPIQLPPPSSSDGKSDQGLAQIQIHSPSINVANGEIKGTDLPPPPTPVTVEPTTPTTTNNNNDPPNERVAGVKNVGEEMFHDLFPLRQLWKPKVEYPLWDKNWDGRVLESMGSKEADRDRDRLIRKNGVTRHIILVRHGQYDETHKEDEKRILTPLGREQAEITGKRIAEMMQGFPTTKYTPCNVTTIHVSNMARAKETADIIASQLPSHVRRAAPDANLNEGRPCHTVPGGRVSQAVVVKTEESSQKIEAAYRAYFHRMEYDDVDPAFETTTIIEGGTEGRDGTTLETNTVTTPSPTSEDPTEEQRIGHPQHEFEIIVCHANVLRYMTCRALQIPPEAWLRLCTFNCSLTYLTIRPTGTVSCRMLGDIGHLGYDRSTFSMHHGFNW
eukprot:CAMPEP_0198276650 /NCGR_PEP_ID=MMETSP1447-20131203/65424_1 /TAXON_ID=420782 /ORGANISM="Chaetoceros dichaeta, Strain CCMP1751" /LENGTH=456 /DNA_ID=CAMNT_0043971609 /DNA_START=41 /DNA_END=1414 /DNA_ORIENTATION=+